MAQPRAVVDVVVAEPLTDQFLEQISLFIGAFGGPEARDTCTANRAQPASSCVQCFVPCRLAEMFLPVAGIDVQPFRGRIGAADQRFGQAVRVVDIVEPEPPLDAEPSFVCRAIDALDELDPVVLDLQADLTTDTAERADASDLAVVIGSIALLVFISHRRR